jgi:hypothetical protein
MSQEAEGTMATYGRVAACLLLVGLLMLQLVAPALAALSIPAPLSYYDSDNNGTPDAGAYTIRTAGLDSVWTAGREARITAAVGEWNGDTQWNPNVNLAASPGFSCYDSVSCHGVWIDGTEPPLNCGGPFPANALAVNCRLVVRRFVNGAPYDDIEDSDILFHTAGTGHPIFTYSAAGSAEDDVWDFQGVLTHEVGHSIFLKDIPQGSCATGGTLETMCGYVYAGWQTTQQRTLVPDDVTSANGVY